MRITHAGAYVMVQKYGIEGLLCMDDTLECTRTITTNVDKEEAYLPAVTTPLKVFDCVDVKIVAKMVEFRRSILLVYRP